MPVLLALSVVVGLAVGSFLNVVVWRLPRGESVAAPASACPTCRVPIRPRDNLPVASWLLLRGRCRSCGARISARYPLVEIATAVLFAVLALRLGPDAALPAYLYLAAVGLALALIDIDVQRLPDVLTKPAYVVVAALLALAAALGSDSGQLVRALLGGCAMFAVYFALYAVSRGRMGFGDVKLAGPLGMATGWLGWDAWVVGLYAGCLLGGAWSLALMALRRAGWRSKVPYGPFMLLGVLLAVLAGQPLAAAYVSLTVG